MLRKRRGQSTLEYALIIVAVVIALVALQRYMRRSIQGRVRASSDQIGNQFDVESGKSTLSTIGGQKVATGTDNTVTHESRRLGDDGGGIKSEITKGEVIETKVNDEWNSP